MEEIVKKITYHDNGNIYSIEHYKNNLLHGPIKFYQENGCLSAEGKYKNGHVEGDYIHYCANGGLLSITTYKNNTKLVEVYFNENGKIESVTNYVDGLEHSKFEFEYKNKKLINVKTLTKEYLIQHKKWIQSICRG